MLVNVVNAYAASGKYDKICSDPGEEYEAWINSYPQAESVEELKETWTVVENAWAERGVDAGWEFVEKAAENYYINNADALDSCIMDAIHEEWDKANTAAGMRVPFLVIFAVLVITFAIRTPKSCTAYKEAKRYFDNVDAIKNKANREYNETTYIDLVKQRENSMSIYRALEALRRMIKKLKKVD